MFWGNERRKNTQIFRTSVCKGRLKLVCPWLSFVKLSPLHSSPEKSSKSAQIRNYYTMAKVHLRSAFFGERKNSCSSKFEQLLLLTRMKAKCSENRAAQGFHFRNSFISNILDLICTCEVPAARGCISQGLTVVSKDCKH